MDLNKKSHTRFLPPCASIGTRLMQVEEEERGSSYSRPGLGVRDAWIVLCDFYLQGWTICS
jgi:hypothetical protein